MSEDVGDGFRVEADVEGVQDGAGEGNAEMGFDHGRGVGKHHGDDLAGGDVAGEGGGEAAAAGVGLDPGLAEIAVDDGDAVWEDVGGAAEEAQGGERRVVRARFWQVEHAASGMRPAL